MKINTPSLFNTFDRTGQLDSTSRELTATSTGDEASTRSITAFSSLPNSKSFADILNNSMRTSVNPPSGRTLKGTLSTTLLPGQSATDALNAGSTTDPAAEAHAKAEKAAEGLVSNALILPILKQIRRSPFGENSVFSGGNGEKSFGPEFDMELADRIAHSPRLGVKNALVARLEKHANAAHASKSVTKVKVPAGIDIHG